MKELKRYYRQQNKVTDVISFAMQELVEGEVGIIGENIPLVLGDIVISLDQAKIQAKEYEHSLERELGFLIVHGFLHLLGYEDRRSTRLNSSHVAISYAVFFLKKQTKR